MTPRNLMKPPEPGDLVFYSHPDWGPSKGRALTPPQDHGDGPVLLVQDLAPEGAREWWPLASLVVIARAPVRPVLKEDGLIPCSECGRRCDPLGLLAGICGECDPEEVS